MRNMIIFSPPPDLLPGCHSSRYSTETLHSSVGGHGVEEQRGTASLGRCPGLSAEPHWSQKLRYTQQRVSVELGFGLNPQAVVGYKHLCNCDSEDKESSKILMDPRRDATNPFVGLAFKLEVMFF